MAANISILALVVVLILLVAGVALIVLVARNPTLKVVAGVGGAVLAFLFLFGVLCLLYVFSARQGSRQEVWEARTQAIEIRSDGSRASVEFSTGTQEYPEFPTEPRRPQFPTEPGPEFPPTPPTTERTVNQTNEAPVDRATPAGAATWDEIRRGDLLAGERLIELSDDLEAWNRDSILGFEHVEQTRVRRWVEDAAGSRKAVLRSGGATFLYWAPGDSGQLVGYSGKETSTRKAKEKALASAQRKLAALVLADLSGERPGLDVAAAEPLALEHVSRRRNVPPNDSYHLERASYRGARLYRAAVVVDASDKKISELAHSVRRELDRGWLRKQESLKAWLMTGFSLLVLAFAVFLIYAFVNAGTKGHFAWPLRIVSMVVFALVCAAIMVARSQPGM